MRFTPFLFSGNQLSSRINHTKSYVYTDRASAIIRITCISATFQKQLLFKSAYFDHVIALLSHVPVITRIV